MRCRRFIVAVSLPRERLRGRARLGDVPFDFDFPFPVTGLGNLVSGLHSIQIEISRSSLTSSISCKKVTVFRTFSTTG